MTQDRADKKSITIILKIFTNAMCRVSNPEKLVLTFSQQFVIVKHKEGREKLTEVFNVLVLYFFSFSFLSLSLQCPCLICAFFVL